MNVYCYATGCERKAECAFEVDGKETTYYCAQHVADEISRAVAHDYDVFVVVTKRKGKER